MMTLFGLFASHSVELQNEFLSYFAEFLPPTAFQLLRGVTTEIAAHASQGKLTFGVVSALWCISSCVSSMICFLNAAFHVRETRPWFKARAIALVLESVASILLLTALFMGLQVPLCGLVRGRTSIESVSCPRLEGYSVADCYLLRCPIGVRSFIATVPT